MVSTSKKGYAMKNLLAIALITASIAASPAMALVSMGPGDPSLPFPPFPKSPVQTDIQETM